jgi:hypothetical protein
MIAGTGQSEKRLVRYGSPDSIDKLVADAAKAEGVIGLHGVSAIFRKPPKGSHGQADFDEVTRHFPVIQTGANKAHYTVVLPKPVTQEITDLFNGLFRLVTG